MPAPSKRRLSARKKPRQERAVATVEAILQATTYILVREGWAALTTNRIAERAGVNIASLYQYFPNKEAIVIELNRRHVRQARAAFPPALPELRRRRSLPELLAVMIDAGVREHRVAPALHRVFTEELPRSARPKVPEDVPHIDDWQALVTPLFRNVPDLDLAVFIARVTIHAVIHEAASERPELLDRPELIEELVLLMDRYLRRPARRTARAQAGRRLAPRSRPG